MRNTLLPVHLLWLLAFVSDSTADDFLPFEGPRPLAVFLQSDPWAAVIGSDTPWVVLYEGGEAIFIKQEGEEHVCHRVILDETELAAFRQKMQPVTALKTLQRAYDMAPGVTDQPEAIFYLRDGTREITTSIYGLMAAGTHLPAFTSVPTPDKPPAELLNLHQWLCAFSPAKSSVWTPKYVEVMLWGYSYAPDPSIQWPKEWPSLTSERTLKRGESYSIFLDGELLPQLRQFLATRKEKGAVELGGKKWAASWRFTFPGEPTWRAALAKAAEK